jgi:hypothetical protein
MRTTRISRATAVAFLVVLGWLAVRARPHPAQPQAIAARESALVTRVVTAPVPSRWSDPNGAPSAEEEERARRRVEQRVRLANGTQAVLSASRAVYPAMAAVELTLELSSASGAPLSGRLDLETTIRDASGRSPPLVRAFAEQPEHPGRYQLIEPIPPDWPLVSVVLPFRERPDRADPGDTRVLQLQIEHDRPAALDGQVVGRFGQTSLEVLVPVASLRTGRGGVRAVLVNGEGQTLGEASVTGDLSDGRTALSLLYELPPPPRPQALYLQDLTLFVDGVSSDFRPAPIPVSVRPEL